MNVHIRWMIRRDIAAVLSIEQASFEFSWSEEDFLLCIRKNNCIGMVAECDERVVGFMIYEFNKDHLHILKFAVHPDVRRRGVGCQMVEKLISKLRHGGRYRISLEISESNFAGQMFFKNAGFVATGVLRNHYIQNDDDAYEMVYSYKEPVVTCDKIINRIHGKVKR